MTNWFRNSEGHIEMGHPLSDVHHHNVGHDDRKQRAVTGQGVISRSDVHAVHVNAAQPWKALTVGHHHAMELPEVEKLDLTPLPFHRARIDDSWHALELAPDHSRYAHPQLGALGDAIAVLFSHKPQ